MSREDFSSHNGLESTASDLLMKKSCLCHRAAEDTLTDDPSFPKSDKHLSEVSPNPEPASGPQSLHGVDGHQA